MFDLMALESDDRLLEIGFGGGALLMRSAHQVSTGSITGIELSEAMLANLEKRTRSFANVKLQFGSVEDLPAESQSFSCVVSVNTVYFWRDLKRGLQEIARVSRPRARLVLGFGSDTGMRAAGYEERGFSLYSVEQISTCLESVGYSVQRVDRLERPNGDFIGLLAQRED
jgi:ubiquinone/menaquinone biosynthesis C-methylase UbiE